MTRRASTAGAILVLAVASSAFAAWPVTTTTSSAARTISASLSVGLQPSASLDPPGDADIVVSWSADAGGIPLTGYEVHAYDETSGTERPVAGTCAGVVAATSCIDESVSPGAWVYSVVPRRHAWSGAESESSSPVIVS